MHLPFFEFAWLWPQLEPMGIIFLDIVIALLLGLMVGYERSYRGRAAGMRTYSFVCMASCAMTAMMGYQDHWFAGMEAFAPGDPGRVIQGIITGIGFLGAGVIMRDGLNISGLTTAASIWAVSAVGILVGLGMYLPAFFLAMLLMIVMMWGNKIEVLFPTHYAVAVNLQFAKGIVPPEAELRELFIQHGYKISRGSYSTVSRLGQYEWRFIVVSIGRNISTPLIALNQLLAATDGVDACHLSYSRN